MKLNYHFLAFFLHFLIASSEVWAASTRQRFLQQGHHFQPQFQPQQHIWVDSRYKRQQEQEAAQAAADATEASDADNQASADYPDDAQATAAALPIDQEPVIRPEEELAIDADPDYSAATPNDIALRQGGDQYSAGDEEIVQYDEELPSDQAQAQANAADLDAEAEAATIDPREPAPVLDLHNQEFCVDVSTYGPVEFEATPREKCETTFEKQCETKSEQVCEEVTEIQCNVVPFTECQMTMEATPYKSYEMVQRIYKKKECTEGMDTVQHTKMMPECRNVTKQNCITKWEEDEEGNQIWAGNEACEPVTWRECKLVPRQVDFKVPKIDCVEGDEIPYTDCIDAEKTQMTTKMSCEVKHTTDCKPVTATKCKGIEFQECSEVPVENCTTQEMMVPNQEKEHKKKCLLPDDVVPRGARRLALSARGSRTPQVLPLERFAEAASVRHARKILQGARHVSQPRLVKPGQVGQYQQQRRN